MSTDDRGHVAELLDAWRTDELEPAERARVDAHLTECERCRAELSALGPLTAALERGMEARRRSATELEPDWAAQRAAIVARTSGRARAGPGERHAFWRWAPQAALAAVAVIVIGVVWRETAPESPPEPARIEAPVESGSRAGQDEIARDDAAVDPPPRAERERPAAPPPAMDRLGEGKAEDRRQAAAETPEEEAANEAALADRAAPAAADAVSDDRVRFERQARAALAERDTLAARRALALWGDTLAPRLDVDADVRAGGAALADSLEEMLRGAE